MLIWIWNVAPGTFFLVALILAIAWVRRQDEKIAERKRDEVVKKIAYSLRGAAPKAQVPKSQKDWDDIFSDN